MTFVAAPAGPATASAAIAATSVRISLRIIVSCSVLLVEPGFSLLRDRLMHAARPVLLTPSMALPSPDRRALIAAGTGRVGRAIAARLPRGGWRGGRPRA